MSKWITINGKSSSRISVGVISAEYLALNQQWGSKKGGLQTTFLGSVSDAWLHVQTDQSHGTNITWGMDPDRDKMPGSFEPIVNATYSAPPSIPLQVKILCFT